MLDRERFSNILKSLRVKRGKEWTQEKMARSLGVSRRTYVGWENGESSPPKTTLRKLANLFQLDEAETEALFRSTHQSAPVRHNLPFARNPFFTGRQPLLQEVARLFKHNARIALTQPVSISGLGGIGKTQLALEYAHLCYPHTYHSVLWVNAADKASLEASYLALAPLLQLPEQQEPEVDRTVHAVKHWLEEHTHWLLILDNADDLELACSFLPTKAQGHILFTTRSQIVGHLAALVQVEALPPEEGLLFLLRRCGVLKPGAELENLGSDLRQEASALVELLGGHPLALDQAGAYLEETRDPSVEVSGASFAEYRHLYQQQRRMLLQKRGCLKREHPEAVTTTLEMSLHKAYELHPNCAEVLAFCALLHPDAIPEELLREASGLNLDLLQFNEVMRALRRYSLLKRDSEKQVLSLHRLVQAVIKDGMDQETLRLWIERVVQAVNGAFPVANFEQWPQCERYLPHALVCVDWIEEQDAVSLPQTAHLLTKVGSYLRQRGQYARTESLLVQALAIREQHLGVEHPDTATSLFNLALLSRYQGKYEQAEALYQRALSLREQHLGAEHLDTIKCLDDLAIIYWQMGKYSLAEPLFLRTLTIREQRLGAEHIDTSTSLNNLAILYYQQGKYSLAEPLLVRSLAIQEQLQGAEHPDTAKSLSNLGALYYQQKKYEQAEQVYQQVLAIYEQHLGANHDDTAKSLSNLAQTYQAQGKYALAEPLFERAIAIFEPNLGANHPDTATCLSYLAQAYQEQGKYALAEPLFQRALVTFEQVSGSEHPSMAETLQGLAELAQYQGKYEQAEALYCHALALREKLLGEAHPETQKTREAYAAFLHKRKP